MQKIGNFQKMKSALICKSERMGRCYFHLNHPCRLISAIALTQFSMFWPHCSDRNGSDPTVVWGVRIFYKRCSRFFRRKHACYWALLEELKCCRTSPARGERVRDIRTLSAFSEIVGAAEASYSFFLFNSYLFSFYSWSNLWMHSIGKFSVLPLT